MAYSASTCTSLIDLLTSIKVFLTDNGWTLDGWKDSLTGWASTSQAAGKELHIHKGDTYFSLRTAIALRAFNTNTTGGNITGIALCGATGYDDSKTDTTWASQPGFPANTESGYTTYPIGASIQLSDGSYPYYLFLNEDCFVCCIEYEAGKYKWMSFGLLHKLGTYTGGAYFSASEGLTNSYANGFLARTATPFNSSYIQPANCFLYLNHALGTKWFLNGRSSNSSTYDSSIMLLHPQGVTSEFYSLWSYRSFLFTVYKQGYNSLTARRCMSPIPFFIQDISDNKFFTAGSIAGLRLINMQNLSSGDEFTLGSDVWKVFPNSQQAGTYYSNVGLAVLKG